VLFVLAGSIVIVWCSYLPFLQFDDASFLRYLLPSWPAMALGMAAVVAIALRSPLLPLQTIGVAILVGVGAFGVYRAASKGALSVAAGELKYVEVAHAVATITPPNAVVFAVQHSGSLRYYAGRMTVRWDRIGASDIDTAVTWLADHGHRTYLLMEPWEVDQFRGRPGVIARVDWPAMASFRNGQVLLYDAVNRDRETKTTIVRPPSADRSCFPPAPVGPFSLR